MALLPNNRREWTMTRLSGLLAGLIFLTLSFLPVMPRAAEASQKATIDDFVVTNSDTDLLLYLTVKNCFTPEMETAVQNGIPATFTFYVELYRTRKGWFDKQLVDRTFYHTLTHDSLKEMYQIEFSEKDRRITTGSLAEAKRLMAEVNGFKTIKLKQLKPGVTYRLLVKAKLAKKTLPLYFHYLIPFFSSLWDFETDWYALEFTY
jgi:hypothetical protein